MRTVFIKKDGKIVREAEIVQISPTHVIFEAEEGSGINTCIYYSDIFGESDWAKEKGYNIKTSGYQVHATKGEIDGFELNYDFIVQAGVSPLSNEPDSPNHRDLLGIIEAQCKLIENTRTPMTVMMQLMSEVGELAEEMRVRNDSSFYKKEGKDGVLGEGCDILIALMDLLVQSGYTINDIMSTTNKKLLKWWRKTEKERLKNQKYDVWVFNNQYIYKQYSVDKESSFMVDGKYGHEVRDAIAELETFYRSVVCKWANDNRYILVVTPSEEVKFGSIKKIENAVQSYIQENGNKSDIDEIENIVISIIRESNQ